MLIARDLDLSILLLSVVPHITDAIQEWVMKQARVSVDDDGVEPEVCIIEVRWRSSLFISLLMNDGYGKALVESAL